MKLAILSHKPCWPSAAAPNGYATDGGFPFQMAALADLFDAVTVTVPCSGSAKPDGEAPLHGPNLSVVALTTPHGIGAARKLAFPFWLLRNAPAILREVRRADAVHAPIPGDIGTVGMVLALMLSKPCFVRYCGNWYAQRTAAEHFWKWFMERFAGGRNVMLATGGALEGPSSRNANVRWIFSTSLRADQLKQHAVRRAAPARGRARLIIVCRQEPRKGTGRVIAALPAIARDFPDVTLDVVGDGEAVVALQAQAMNAGVAHRVTFHGKLDQRGVLALLAQADLFVYPTSASEGFPKVVLEALATGLPVVTTRVSVLPRIIGEGCGLLLADTMPETVAAAVRSVLGDPAGYGTMSLRALDVASTFSLEKWAATIGEHLREAWGPLRADA